MSKKIIYDYENMIRAGQLLNMIKISGVDNIRILAELAMILDSGKVVGKNEETTKEENDGDH